MSIILDGMDQSKTFLPRFVQQAKQVSNMWKLKTHVTGAIVHGHGVYGYFDSCQWPHASNMTIHVLVNILYMYRDNLPDTLYLQMDNCGRENKNRFVFAFCALLVELKVFRKIKVSFLMVGHTHEDVDQMFSRYSTYLRRQDVFTMDCLTSSFENCYTPSPTAVVLDEMPDVCRWLHTSIQDMAYHSKPHVFKFTRDSNGKAKMVIKKWSTDTEWESCVGTAMGHVLKDHPTGSPLLMKLDYRDQDLERLDDSINSASKFMSAEARRWWDQWFAETEDSVYGESLSDVVSTPCIK